MATARVTNRRSVAAAPSTSPTSLPAPTASIVPPTSTLDPPTSTDTLLALAEPDGPERDTRLHAAVDHYQRAIALSQAYPELLRGYWTNLAAIYEQLGNHANADQARKEAQAHS